MPARCGRAACLGHAPQPNLTGTAVLNTPCSIDRSTAARAGLRLAAVLMGTTILAGAAMAQAPAPAAPAPVAAAPVTAAVAPRVSVPVARVSEPAAVIVDEPVVAAAVPQPAPPAEQPKDRDELAFLRSVLGRSTPATHPGAQPAVEESPSAAGRRSMGSNSSRTSSGIARPSTPELFQEPEPLAMPADQARESGAFSRATGSFTMPTSANPEVVKSLKCSECGTLNYPTEWYCERCGGELAAF